jgi:hypothetical protein
MHDITRLIGLMIFLVPSFVPKSASALASAPHPNTKINAHRQTPPKGYPPNATRHPLLTHTNHSTRTVRRSAAYGTGQGVWIMPRTSMAPSSARRSLSVSARLRLISRVSRPCMVLACAQRSRPCCVFAPVDAPPCVRHTALPRIAGLQHCTPLRLLLA